jgi:hypothetical protein
MQTASSCSLESERSGAIGEDTDDFAVEISAATRIVKGEQVAARA